MWSIAINPHLLFYLATEPQFCSRSPQDVTYVLGDRALDSKLLAMSSPAPPSVHYQANISSGLSGGCH